MSVQYTQYLTPDAEHFRFCPGSDQVSQLVAKLASAGWLTAGQDECRAKIYSSGVQRMSLRLTELARKVGEVLSSGGTLKLTLPLQMKRAESPFWEAPAGTALTQEYCEDLRLLLCGALAMVVPDNVGGSLLPCPHCGGNLAEPGLPAEESFVPGIEEHLAACPLCHAKLTIDTPSGSSPSGIDGAPKPESVPFFRFALCVSAGGPSQDPPPPDPVLVKILTETFGVGFRQIGRWS